MYRALALLLLCFAALPAAAQNDAGPGDICKTKGACRHIESLTLEAADGKSEDIPLNADFPWVVQANVMLFIGESVTIRLVEAGDYLDPVLVRGGAESAATPLKDGEIRFTFRPSSRGQTNLDVESRYSKTLDYAALIVTAGGPSRTSVCSLQKGITVFENWSDPIVQMALWHFVVTDEPGCKTIQWDTGRAK